MILSNWFRSRCKLDEKIKKAEQYRRLFYPLSNGNFKNSAPLSTLSVIVFSEIPQLWIALSCL
jgi:hypothetical protein